MATNKVYCSYQEVIDMHTEQGHATAIGIHTPVGDTPRKMFSGFFDQFKRYKYLGCSISFVPVATLPADPSQIAVDGGDYSIDPRDLVNPIMFHGCHGDDMGTILNRLYGDNTEVSDAFDVLDYDAAGGDYGNAYANLLARLYYKALTDNTWKKAHPQKGFRKKGLRPLVYSVATNRQLDGNAVGIDNPNLGFPFFEYGDPTSDIGEDDGQAFMKTDKQNIQLFTPRLTGLGWLDTRNVLTSPVDIALGPGETTLDQILSGVQKGLIDQVRYAELPKIYMGMILLAPAFKTEMWFRVILNHHFCFKDFRGISFKPEVTGVPSYTNAEDIYDPETYDDIPLDDGGDEPEPEPDPPTPPTPTEIVPCAVLIHASYTAENDLAITDGVISYIAPGTTEKVQVSTFARSPETGNPVRVNGFGVPSGSRIIVEGTVSLEYFVNPQHVVFSDSFSGPVTTTMDIGTDSKTYVTGPQPYDTVVMPESEQVVVYGWLGYSSDNYA